MATTITAGNATNGAAISSDNTGILELKSGTGSGTTAISIDTAQIVTGTAGNLMLVSGTAQTASGSSVDFTGIPSWVKRITVMQRAVSLSGSSLIIVQLGSGSFTTSGYASGGSLAGATNITVGMSATNGLLTGGGSGAANVFSGATVLVNITGNTWVASSSGGFENASYFSGAGGSIALSGTLDRVRITTVNGTDTFDAGTINILYE